MAAAVHLRVRVATPALLPRSAIDRHNRHGLRSLAAGAKAVGARAAGARAAGARATAARATAARAAAVMAAAAAAAEPLGRGSTPPKLFDGTTRLYYSAACPYAQRVVIAVNHKGLHEIERVEINLRDKPEWYTAQVYPVGKVPCLEHKGTVVGESLDLLFYLDQHFGGPTIVPKEEGRAEEAKELVRQLEALVMPGYTALSQLYQHGAAADVEAALGATLDKVELNLSRYQQEGPFFLGSFSYVDIAYLPFMERFRLAFNHFCAADIAAARPCLLRWFQAAEQLPAYTSTRVDPQRTIATYKQMLDAKYFERVAAAASASASASSEK